MSMPRFIRTLRGDATYEMPEK